MRCKSKATAQNDGSATRAGRTTGDKVLPKETKITEKTLISLHVVTIVVSIAIWNIRLGDRVGRVEDELKKIEKNRIELRLYRIEDRLKLKSGEE